MGFVNLYLLGLGTWHQLLLIVLIWSSYICFSCSFSSTVNHHLLQGLSSVTGGTYQHFNPDTKSQWQGKLRSQLEKACQPSLSNVHVDWLQTNDRATPPTQAPNHIPSLFSGCRQVVYGFVESCTQVRISWISIMILYFKWLAS